LGQLGDEGLAAVPEAGEAFPEVVELEDQRAGGDLHLLAGIEGDVRLEADPDPQRPGFQMHLAGEADDLAAGRQLAAERRAGGRGVERDLALHRPLAERRSRSAGRRSRPAAA
jgi:hypothetical protein